MSYIKRIIIPLISAAIIISYAIAMLNYIVTPQFVGAKDIKQLEDFRYGVVYFGRPTCPACTDIKNVISTTAENIKVRTLYFNSDYFRSDSGLNEEELQNIFIKFSVNDVPMLVAVFQGNVVDVLTVDEATDMSLTGNEISNFYIKASKYLTWNNPYDIAISIVLPLSMILFNLSFCKICKKETVGLILSICNIGFMFVILHSFRMSMRYIDMMGRSGNMLFGSMSIVSFILCLASIFRTLFVYVKEHIIAH